MTSFVHVPSFVQGEKEPVHLKLERHPVQLMLGEQVHDLINGTRYVKILYLILRAVESYQTFLSREATYFENSYIF